MNNNYISPVNQDFIWMAEYMDGNHLSEFDLVTKIENNFYDIERDKLLRFGLIGHGIKLYYEVYGGIFKVAGQMIEVLYKVGDKEYYLTGQQAMYCDIISYKNAEATINLLSGGGEMNSQITQFNFGYKTNLNIDGINFNFKAICMIPYMQNAYMNLWLVADRELDGQVVIKRNGKIVQEIEAPLHNNVGGEVNWLISN